MNLSEYTTEQLNAQHTALMTSIMIVGKNSETSETLYEFAISISNEIEKRESVSIENYYLSPEQFDKDLDTCLTIIEYPSKDIPYYKCEYISYSLRKKIVHIYINK